jgi:hypothetical protein
MTLGWDLPWCGSGWYVIAVCCAQCSLQSRCHRARSYFLWSPSRDSVGPPHVCATPFDARLRRYGASRISRNSEFSMRMVNCIYVHTRKSSWSLNCSSLECDRPQHDRPAACVIARQYSSAVFVSLHFHVLKDKSGARLEMLLFQFY